MLQSSALMLKTTESLWAINSLQKIRGTKLADEYKNGTEAKCKIIKSIEKGIIVELPKLVDGFIPASQLAVSQIKNFSELFQPGLELNAEVIEFDKESKKIVLSVIEYLKDKDQKEIDEYVSRFKIKKFSLADVIDRTKNNS